MFPLEAAGAAFLTLKALHPLLVHHQVATVLTGNLCEGIFKDHHVPPLWLVEAIYKFVYKEPVSPMGAIVTNIYVEEAVGTGGCGTVVVSGETPTAVGARHVLMDPQEGWGHRTRGDFKGLHHKMSY
jgi:hypothetical protein